MKKYLTLSLFCLLSVSLYAQSEEEPYDPMTEYEMKTYYMAFLKAGPERSQDSTETARIQQAHLLHIKKLADEGKICIAGPFLDEGELRGIFIFNTETLEEAIALTKQDPAVQAGRLTIDVRPWMAAKGSTLP